MTWALTYNQLKVATQEEGEVLTYDEMLTKLYNQRQRARQSRQQDTKIIYPKEIPF